MNKKQDTSLDLFTPIQEIFHEVCVLVVQALFELIKIGFNKATNKKKFEPIVSKDLTNKKKAMNPLSLGIDCQTRKDVWLEEIDFTKHSFIVGASGYGKTNLLNILMRESLRRGKPVIFIDPKADYKTLKEFQELSSAYNRKCLVVSPKYQDSSSINPLKEGSVNQIVDRIMRSFEWSEPYYEEASSEALYNVIKNLDRSGSDITFENILKELETSFSKDKDVKGLKGKIKGIVESDFNQFLRGENTLSISEVREQGACLYIGLSTQGYGRTARAIGKVILGDLLYHSSEVLSESSKRHIAMEKPLSIFLDEFGSFVTNDFIELLNKCRAAGRRNSKP